MAPFRNAISVLSLQLSSPWPYLGRVSALSSGHGVSRWKELFVHGGCRRVSWSVWSNKHERQYTATLWRETLAHPSLLQTTHSGFADQDPTRNHHRHSQQNGVSVRCGCYTAAVTWRRLSQLRASFSHGEREAIRIHTHVDKGGVNWNPRSSAVDTDTLQTSGNWSVAYSRLLPDA
ncbi:hypothetical protein CSPX01_11179 [Colletotrichum filicis]|nr:hypothetical protein CSPX01_11179 [Colletotrichum filicis]